MKLVSVEFVLKSCVAVWGCNFKNLVALTSLFIYTWHLKLHKIKGIQISLHV